MFRVITSATIVLIAALHNSGAEAADIVLKCDSPQGRRVNYGTVVDLNGKAIVSVQDGIRWSDGDSYPEMFPVFVWKEAAPDKLLVSLGTFLNLTDEAIVTYRDQNQIQAVVRTCGTQSCTTALYALFPRLGFATRVESSHMSLFHDHTGIGEGVTRMWATTCKG
jgi:hypothetical protein